MGLVWPQPRTLRAPSRRNSPDHKGHLFPRGKNVGQAHACPSRGYYAYYMAEATCLVVETYKAPAHYGPLCLGPQAAPDTLHHKSLAIRSAWQRAIVVSTA